MPQHKFHSSTSKTIKYFINTKQNNKINETLMRYLHFNIYHKECTEESWKNLSKSLREH